MSAPGPGDDLHVETSPSLRKRLHHEVEASDLESTPTKRHRSAGRPTSTRDAFDTDEAPVSPITTKLQLDDSLDDTDEPRPSNDDDETPKPAPRRRGRPPKSASKGNTPTPRANRTALLKTPTKTLAAEDGTPRRLAADRSARKKSVKALLAQVRNGASDSDSDEGGRLVREIYDSSADEDADADEPLPSAAAAAATAADPSTPSKTPRRGRPPKKARSPTPPRDLPPHEQYFLHNKPGRPKTSDNHLGALALLTHEEYFDVLRSRRDRHAADIEYLESLHAQSFPQWTFEASQGFSLCLYGFGSKRALLHKFARHLHRSKAHRSAHKVVVVNGYAETTSAREVLGIIGAAVQPTNGRVPLSQPAVMVQAIAAHLASRDVHLTLLVNSIDAPPMRKPGMQAALAQLAALPRVTLVCSADTPDFSLLWDIGVRTAFNFVFHDCTTFVPLTVEVDVVDSVHELLGRKAHRVNGREGVAFVLRSLPENAKNLFRLLLGELLITMEEEGSMGDDGVGVEYRMLYNKAVEEFICTSEMAFRTLLKEFHDHQIITSHKDALGTELLSVPFGKDELEAILEDLME
ncbi:origin recognition complex subunit 2-domain-containing protein [Stachybotrys elegans]|uniref:Origin recognition complex subunit 2 n=1 Tax=Stachybotrys elegans TaxID=80388 RepID=A0A8K0WSD8_9HYPO|nr:origin recognition complex subunit 2-domain-containing protein [Stachybotrys elegans]